MRKILLTTFFILFFTISVQAQNTNVSATVTDSGAVIWANGTYTFNFVPAPRLANGPYFNNGVPFTPVPITGTLSGTGSLTSVAVPSNTSITPSGSSWTITYCPQATAPCQTSGPITITGASQTITSNFTPNALVIAPGVGTLVYATAEVPVANLGAQIFLIGTGLQICTVVTGTACTTWSSSGGGSVSQVTTLPATCSAGSAFQLPSGQVFFCGAGNTYRTTSAAVGEVDPTSFGAKYDGQLFASAANTCSWTSGQATFSCTGANLCNGTTVSCPAGVNSSVGKQFSATINSSGGVAAQYQGTLAFANVATTIISVQSLTQGTISQNFTSSSGANWMVSWATNDDTAITVAEVAWSSQGKCGAFAQPAGITATLIGHWLPSTVGTNCLGIEPQADYTASVYGRGIGSTIVGIFPGFNFAGCPVTGCFGGYKESVFHDFQFNGFGWGNTGLGGAKNLLEGALGSQWSQVACNALGGSDPLMTGLEMDIGFRGWGLSIDGCGGGGSSVAGCFVNATIVKMYYSFCGDNLGLNLFVSSGGDITDYGSDYGGTGGTTSIRVDGIYRGIQSNLFTGGAANSTAINQSNGASSLVILDGARFNNTATTSNGVFMNGAGQKLILAAGTIVGGTTAAVNRSAGVVFIDPSVVFAAGAITSLAPTCPTVTGATATCAAVAGSTNEKGTLRITVTAAGTATGTVTMNFAGTYNGASATTPSCNFSPALTGTGAWNARATMMLSTRSSTAPVITWDNNAAALGNLTWDIDYVCVPR